MDSPAPRFVFRKNDPKVIQKKGESVPRSPRVFEKQGAWYFTTREGILVGPYAEAFDAELGASLLIARLAQMDDEGASRGEILRFLHHEPTICFPTEEESETTASTQTGLRPAGLRRWLATVENAKRHMGSKWLGTDGKAEASSESSGS